VLVAEARRWGSTSAWPVCEEVPHDFVTFEGIDGKETAMGAAGHSVGQVYRLRRATAQGWKSF
jgi:hypothetical protein